MIQTDQSQSSFQFQNSLFLSDKRLFSVLYFHLRVCIQIESVLDMLRVKGIQLINQTPLELPGRKMAFIHPKSANGVLVELYELTK